ncbi:WD40-repeat-containing domain protein [Rhodocollybia butyracea]|uniref:WD40-repeat-containing domain protein n=1 Tax=Rhodocollybia butyracea TaxID=206335 RepID=A0A9P5TY56_9AGAR|nr:WD40-repeat-containing domain protein [Rhodocollybia butyracea]
MSSYPIGQNYPFTLVQRGGRLVIGLSLLNCYLDDGTKLQTDDVRDINWKPNRIHLPGHDIPNLFVAIDIDDKRVYQTTPSRKWEAMWNQICSLSVDSPSSAIALQVFHKSTIPPSKCLAKKKMEIGQLLKTDEGRTDFSIVLKPMEGNHATDTLQPTLIVRLTSIDNLQAAAVALANTTQDTETLQSTGTGSTIAKIMNTEVNNGDLLSNLGTVLSKLRIIHPYSNVAWNVLDSVYKAVEKQKETDKDVCRLVQTMAEVYAFAKDIESASEKIKRLETTVYALVKQTEECALFIREYTGHGFGVRLLKNILSEDSDKIKGFISAFQKFWEYLDRGTALETLYVSTKALVVAEEIGKKVEEISEIMKGNAQTQMLNELEPVKMDAGLRLPCLPRTREEIRGLITNWLITPPDDNNPGNILWLSGVAGAGKSTIATSISQYFRELGRLGAFLFFNRADKSRSNPADVIRTIAFYLARSNTYVASAICDAIRNISGSIDSLGIHIQFQKLLLEPLRAAQNRIHGPIVIVLDALDECGNADTRRTLVSLISDEFPKLPPAVRFFITSRPDSDIASKFENQPKIAKHLLDITLPSSLVDICIYLNDEMRKIRQHHSAWNLSLTWPGESNMGALTKHSSGLFIWASTATKYLLGSYNPNEALESILDKDQTTVQALDDIYAKALEVAGLWNNTTFVRDAQAALSVVVLGKTPVSDTMIDRLLDLKYPSSHIFSRLGCVLQWAHGQDVKILHASFSDYLTDHGRSGDRPWFINPASLEPQIARGCLHILKKELQFNICEFEDSHIYTTKIPGLSECITDLSKHITDHVSPQLFYSSLYWASHLAVIGSATPHSATPIGAAAPLLPDGLLLDLKDLMYTKFLFWLEVLCVQQKVGVAIDAFEAVANLAKNYWHDKELADFATDAVKFVLRFAPVISHSVPHIYLSALPFAPSESKVKKKYSSWLVPSKTVDIQSSVSGHWPTLRATIEGHSGNVWSVAFSPDGNHIASGSADRTLRVWDAHTGDLLVGPFNGHEDKVKCVAFSCDGEKIVSGSYDNTVRVWDAQTGKLIGVPLTGHKHTVESLCFSPNGKQIVSASLDKTVHIWDWDDHSEGNTAPLVIKHAASVRAVAFAPDRDQVVSGSDSVNSSGSGASLVQIWDTRTGKLVTGPLKGHTQLIRSVAFSPDGKHILSLSHEAARIWDAYTGTENITITTPMGTNAYSAAFTPNGKQIVVGYADSLLRIWDVQTGALVSAPIDGHSGPVLSVSVSPDGMRIASGSNDKTIRVWDAYQELSAALKVDTQHIGANDQWTVQMYHPGYTGHTGTVHCVAFSPKGYHIASGSWDNTVCVWDACTGTIFTGPLRGHTDAVLCIAFSPNGEQIVSGSKDTTIRVWNVQNGTMVAGPFEGHSKPIWCVAFSPQGDRIVSGSDDKTVCMWDVETSSLVFRQANVHTSTVLSAAFSSDGGQIRSASISGIARVSDAQTGALVEGPFKFQVPDQTYRIRFSPDGQLIGASGKDGSVWVFNLRSSDLRQLEWPTEAVRALGFSQDGKWIVSGSDDTTVHVWDLETRSIAAGPFEGHRDSVYSVDFSPDHRRVVSGSRDTSIRVFETTPDDTLMKALGEGSLGQDGWLLNSMAQPVLWVPPWLHHGLYFPQNSLVIHKNGTTKLDFTHFVEGTAWQECVDLRARLN